MLFYKFTYTEAIGRFFREHSILGQQMVKRNSQHTLPLDSEECTLLARVLIN